MWWATIWLCSRQWLGIMSQRMVTWISDIKVTMLREYCPGGSDVFPEEEWMVADLLNAQV